MNAYKTTWHLVIESTAFGAFIVSVCGEALLDRAINKANEIDGEVRSICSYGMFYHAGQKFDGF